MQTKVKIIYLLKIYSPYFMIPYSTLVNGKKSETGVILKNKQ